MIGTDVSAQARALAATHPAVHACLDPDRVRKRGLEALEVGVHPDDFGLAELGGRGESYVAAQQSTGTRATGIGRLLDLIAENNRADSRITLDLLGGDGLVSRVAEASGRADVTVVTCDRSPFMVAEAWNGAIPALWQSAESLLFRDASVGGVLLAYGSHHIPPAQRRLVAEEALRVLAPGGVFVVHDFLVGSPVDAWFRTVVDVYSATGHPFEHFERDEAAGHLGAAGFAEVRTGPIDDSFVVRGPSRQAAELGLGRYLTAMYGLVRLSEQLGPEGAHRRAFELASEIFGEVELSPHEETGEWSATMPREALVTYGRKPAERR
jgi:SAM-dependent methyltransferase